MASKNKNDILLMTQARLGSTRIPNKMLRPFAGTTLLDILLEKLTKIKSIPQSNIYVSAYEDEIKDVIGKYNLNIFHRSKKSANAEEDASSILEFHDKLPFKYVIGVIACHPLLKVDTIEKFINHSINSVKEGVFAVFKKKTYYWNKDGKMITNWGDNKIMNTKYIDPVYEAAHCLGCSRMDIIKDGYYIDNKLPLEPDLFVMDELEAFDIDYEWQFKLGEKLWKK